MHIAFLDANTERATFDERHGSEMQKFRTLLEPVAPGWRYSDFPVTEGAFPEALAAFDGVMISGSPASVNDTTPWVAQLMDTIRAAVSAEIPVFGACFGHQAVAKALGGTVGYNPQGWVLGRVETANHSPAPWMEGAGPAMALHAAHKEQVTALPRGARVLAGTDSVPHGHLALGTRVFTTQYHPEITPAFMAELVDLIAPELAPEAEQAVRAALPGPLDDALMAGWIARFFRQG